MYSGVDDYSRLASKRQHTLLAMETNAVERAKELISALDK
jgi:hypothetical protein